MSLVCKKMNPHVKLQIFLSDDQLGMGNREPVYLVTKSGVSEGKIEKFFNSLFYI